MTSHITGEAEVQALQLFREAPLNHRKRPRERGGTNRTADGHHVRASQGSVEDSLVFTLRSVQEGTVPSTVSFGPEGTRVGRDPSCCDVVLSAGSISRLHTILSVVGEDVCVHDKSHNGTFINGRLVGRGRCAILRDGDMVSFVNPLLPEVKAFSYTLVLPHTLRHQGDSHRAGASSSVFASLQRAGFTRYTLGPSIGQGSFAVVRLGVDQETGEKVAVKILEKQRFFSDVAFTSLHLEIEMMRSMEHPNIVRVRDAFEAPDIVALVMEYVRGGDLFDYVVGRGRNPFTEDEARFLFVQLLEAVLYIHSRRIVHCDLKPENVLVDLVNESPSPARPDASSSTPTTSGLSGLGAPPPPISTVSVLDDHQDVAKAVSPFNVRLKLTDFGVAKYYGEPEIPHGEEASPTDFGEDDAAARNALGAAASGVGTARYAAPEQLHNAARPSAEGEDGVVLTAAVDVWSLGVLLYIMCAGGLPKHPQADAQVKFSKHMSHLSDDCKKLIQGMMELEPTRRMRLHEICAHPWLTGMSIHGRELCTGDDDDAMSATTILSPRFGRSLRPSGALPDRSPPSALPSLNESPKH